MDVKDIFLSKNDNDNYGGLLKQSLSGGDLYEKIPLALVHDPV